MTNRTGILDDGRALFLVIHHPTHGFMVSGPDVVVAGFESREHALQWLMAFFDMNARRSADLEQARVMDEARLKIEREEMLARLLEPKAKH